MLFKDAISKNKKTFLDFLDFFQHYNGFNGTLGPSHQQTIIIFKTIANQEKVLI